MNYRKSFWLMWALCVAGLLLLYLFVAVGQIAIAYAGVLCMLAGLGQTVKFFRCPYCGKLWRLGGGIPKGGPYGGKEPRWRTQTAPAKRKKKTPRLLQADGDFFDAGKTR